ncbi:hypothetical protein, conserved [Eimeria praecox]|uniref:FPL domain-containing protein n=1 Tax=Eimeria praecox TaxID=51316 RepID=U6G3W5_9EIME|nr:hypothetical protein, conserved [Eimeria praecox]
MGRLLDSLPPYDAVDERNRDFTIETLRQVAEVLVWGEHNNRGYFDIFCEQNVLLYFVQLAEQPTVPNAVKVQLLQTLSIIVQSINKETAVYYMFSNNYINSLLSTKFDFDDEEVASWYVSFIKSLSLLVNPDTIKLFLNERAKHFPIYSESVKFFRAKDSMVLQDLSLRAFLLQRPIFFSHVACYLRELLDGQLLRLTTSRGASPDRGIQDGVLEIEEMLFYIQDIFSLGIQEFSELLAARLLVHCYLPLIGMLGIHVKNKRERGNLNSERTVASAHDSPDGCLHLLGGGDGNCRIGSQGKTPEGGSCPQAQKRLEQGWMWGWSTPEDLYDPKRSNAVSGQLANTAKGSNILPGHSVDLSRSWRARAAEAVSRRLGEGPREKEAGSACMVADESKASAPCGANNVQESQLQSQVHSIANCDGSLRLILFFLIQTFNCIQSEKLLQPLVAALLLHRVPQPLYNLIVAKAPATPDAYKNLRNPTQCAGHIEAFLPIQELSSNDKTREETSEGSGMREATSQTSKGASEAPSLPTDNRERVPSALSFEDRIMMLKRSVDALHRLGYFAKVDDIEELRSLEEATRLENSLPSSPDCREWNEGSGRGQTEGNHIKWCYNPVQQHLLMLLDGYELAQRQCDVCFLVLTTLLQSIFRHPSTTTGFLMRACILPSATPIPSSSTFEISGFKRAGARRRFGSEPATPGRTTLPRTNIPDHPKKSLATLASSIKCSHLTTGDAIRLSISAPATPPLRLYGQSELRCPENVLEYTHYDKMSWCFTAKMLDAIKAHLANPFLRPITLRMALSVITTLITEHILKVQSSEYRARSLEVFVNKMLTLRRAAALATKLCLSVLSDGHTIDVFWVLNIIRPFGRIRGNQMNGRSTEWGQLPTRLLPVTSVFSFLPQARRQVSPRNTVVVVVESNANTFPPYLMVATTDQEIERRSIQVFLLLRRLHRDLSAILQSIRTTQSDAYAVAQKASSILNGVSLEPNPLESEDNAGHEVGESETVGEEATPKLSLEGRNIIRCTVETSSGPATRYCVQDDKRLLLVTPSCIFPGFGDIRTSHPLRNVECRLKTNNSRCMHLLVLDVVPPADGPSQSPSSDSPEGPPTMRVSLTAPPLKEGVRMERPALWEIRLQFADALRCSTVFVSFQGPLGVSGSW